MSKIITDEQITAAFKNTDFGRTDHRALLAGAVLKRLVDYHCGHTITMIMRKLNLTTEKDKVTKLGKEFIRQEYETLFLRGA